MQRDAAEVKKAEQGPLGQTSGESGKVYWRRRRGQSQVSWVNLRMPSRGQGREAWSMDKAAEAAGLGLT